MRLGVKKYSRVEVCCHKSIIRKIPIYCEQYRNITSDELEEKLNRLVEDGWNFFQVIIDDKESQKISIDKNPDLQTESASSEKMATKSHRDGGEIVVESVKMPKITERKRIPKPILLEVKCVSCVHFYLDKEGFTCRAFPKGIPVDIVTEKTKHDHVIEGQKGNYVFKSRYKEG